MAKIHEIEGNESYPENGRPVMLYNGDWYTGYYDFQTNSFIDDFTKNPVNCVTHWRKLPKAPK